ncbi:HTH_Tnp_Tc3_2 domain-containing protein [Trichonephila clavipes]|nr:HTH_Tnp_Tc3_2 domain-containing protein [Trichonephila clavipes]
MKIHNGNKAYKGLSHVTAAADDDLYREIGSRVGRNQTTVMRICDPWMQESTKDQRGRSHPPQCTTSHEDRQIVRMTVADRLVTSRTVAQRECNASFSKMQHS